MSKRKFVEANIMTALSIAVQEGVDKSKRLDHAFLYCDKAYDLIEERYPTKKTGPRVIKNEQPSDEFMRAWKLYGPARGGVRQEAWEEWQKIDSEHYEAIYYAIPKYLEVNQDSKVRHFCRFLKYSMWENFEKPKPVYSHDEEAGKAKTIQLLEMAGHPVKREISQEDKQKAQAFVGDLLKQVKL